jgi:hypothetical protein
VDVIGEQPGVPVEDLGDGVVDRAIERIDRDDTVQRASRRGAAG